MTLVKKNARLLYRDGRADRDAQPLSRPLPHTKTHMGAEMRVSTLLDIMITDRQTNGLNHGPMDGHSLIFGRESENKKITCP